MQVIISSEDTRSLHIRGVLQAQSQGFVTTLLLLFGSAAPRPARAANTPISSVSGKGPPPVPLKLLGDPQGLWHGGSFSAEATASSNGHPVCRGLSYKPMCPQHHKPSLLQWGPHTRVFLPPFLEETAQKACPRFTRPGERHCWVFDQSGNRPGSDWSLENFKCGPSLFCVLIVKIFLLPFLCCVRRLPGCVVSPS